MKTILIASDVTYKKFLNGVNTWLSNMEQELKKRGYNVVILDSTYFKYTFPLPTYPEIQLTFTRRKKVEEIIKKIQPDYIHIATEGSLGFLVRSVCIKNNIPFTTFFHTKFHDYIYLRIPIKIIKDLTIKFLNWFHNKSINIFVSTFSFQQELLEMNFKNVKIIPLGVDLKLFKKNLNLKSDFKHPTFVYFGRIAVEKNIEDFLKCNLPGQKIIIGDGPDKVKLMKKYTVNTEFVGYKSGQELVDLLSISDVCVFTSKTDTFGLTIIEAMACGLPVAAYNVQGPNNIIINGYNGFMLDDLQDSCLKCLKINPENCVRTAKNYSWEKSAEEFISEIIKK